MEHHELQCQGRAIPVKAKAPKQIDAQGRTTKSCLNSWCFMIMSGLAGLWALHVPPEVPPSACHSTCKVPQRLLIMDVVVGCDELAVPHDDLNLDPPSLQKEQRTGSVPKDVHIQKGCAQVSTLYGHPC